MLSAAFNSIEAFDDGSNTPKHFKDVLGHKNQAKWWESMKKGFACYGKQRSVDYKSIVFYATWKEVYCYQMGLH
jgi:hypothetical protein